jgi:hypothetical protein
MKNGGRVGFDVNSVGKNPDLIQILDCGLDLKSRSGANPDSESTFNLYGFRVIGLKVIRLCPKKFETKPLKYKGRHLK